MSDEDTAESLHEEGEQRQHSKRDRLKDALSRTKNKIEKHAAERLEKHAENRRRRKDDDNVPPNDDDVDDFLAAGRTSASSHRPSNESSLLYDTSPRPSTSESHNPKPPPHSPRRVAVPRLDVSSSQRFPNAKTFAGQQVADEDRLRPEFFVRSQSTSAASSSRKQRIRGLSVEFTNAPPVIIGEGGDAAEAPPAEIGRAKARSRSMSPMGRKPNMKYTQNLSPVQQSATSPHLPDGPDMWQPRPFRRVGTSAIIGNPEQTLPPQPPQNLRNGTPIHEQDFVPRTMKRNPTGLDKEFQMTLGTPTSAGTQGGTPGSAAMPIFQPKPQRPAPSYNLIEQGKGPDTTMQSPASQQQIQAEKMAAYGQSPQQFTPATSGQPPSQSLISNTRPSPQQAQLQQQYPRSGEDRRMNPPPIPPKVAADNSQAPQQMRSSPNDEPPPYMQRISSFEQETTLAFTQIQSSNASRQYKQDESPRQGRSGPSPQHLSPENQNANFSSYGASPQSARSPGRDHISNVMRKAVPSPSPERSPFQSPEDRPILPPRPEAQTQSTSQKMTTRTVPQTNRRNDYGEQETGVVSVTNEHIPTPTSARGPAPPHALRRKQDVSQLRQPQTRQSPSDDIYDREYDQPPHHAMVSGVPVVPVSAAGAGGQRFYGKSGANATVSSNNNPPEGFI